MNSSTLVLHEHSSAIHTLPDQSARALTTVAPHALSVAPTARAGEWKISATKFVGSVSVTGLRVLIRPKVRPENVFLFLSAGLPHSAWRDEAFDYAADGDLLPAVLSFFARTVETTLARGVLRSYRERHEALATVRGRIDFPAQLRRAALDLPVACRYDDYTTDNDENRYLRAAVRSALRSPQLPPPDRHRLIRALAGLDEVADTAPTADDIERIIMTRLNEHYRPALRLAEIVLRNLSLVDIEGRRSASAFLVDMPDLFERWVSGGLAARLRGRLHVDTQTHRRLDVGGRIPLRPDLEFRRRSEVVGVADVKYKISDDARARGDDYRQVLAYTVALGLDDGVLIYCRAGDGRSESAATVVRSGTRLHVLTIDAGGTIDAVLTDLDVLADSIAARCSSAALPIGGSP
ncbi:McrC family protein [Pseudonocardia spirodelae]|uniref:Restriction endonuclease n=1 Tax=Pseudonocardia spirodelae TaxID=3133431 RepID=A0ABU8T3R8_9PSEU